MVLYEPVEIPSLEMSKEDMDKLLKMFEKYWPEIMKDEVKKMNFISQINGKQY